MSATAILTNPGHEPAQSARQSRDARTAEVLSDFAACLIPLLEALDWDGDFGRLPDALPHSAANLDLVGLRNTLAHLNYATRPLRLQLDALDPRLTPCLFVPDGGGPQVILDIADGIVRIFDGPTRELLVFARLAQTGTAYLLSQARTVLPAIASKARDESWFTTFARRFRTLVIQLFGITLLLNLLALGVTLFVITVYDRVIATASHSLLLYLGLGMAIVVGFELLFQKIRTRVIAYMGARIDYLVGSEVFKHLLFLPPAQIEHANVGSQVARLKQLESVRKFFTSPLALVFFDLPFVLLFIAVIALLGGLLAVIPVIMIGIYAVVGRLMAPYVRRRVQVASQSSQARQNFLIEMLTNMRAIKYSAAEDTWQERYRGLSADAAIKSHRAGQAASLVQTIAYLLMMLAGVSTLVLGILQVLTGAMSIGALVAIMMLIWRALAPLQMGFLSMTRLEQVIAAIRQINGLMRLPPERDPQAPSLARKNYEGQVSFQNVGLRFGGDTEPALFGVTFDVNPGQIVGIVGPNGAGKSTILKLILGIYHPQNGSVRIDGLDIRQSDPVQLRKDIAYLPQLVQLFDGTIRQNLRFANPSATEEQLRTAVREANLLDEIEALPDGFSTVIGKQDGHKLSVGLEQRLALARTYLKRAPILLLDEPTSALDAASNQAFTAKLDTIRGTTTAFVVTHRLSHMKLMDRLLFFDKGVLCADGPPAEVLSQFKRISNG